MKSKLNSVQLTILLNTIRAWTHPRMQAERKRMDEEREAHNAEVAGAFADGRVKFKAGSKVEHKFSYRRGDEVHFTFKAIIDRKKTDKKLLALIDKLEARDRSLETVTVTPMWADRYDYRVECLPSDKAKVEAALEVVAQALLSGDAASVFKDLKKLLGP